VICLTVSDKARLNKLYPEILNKKELLVIPVALEKPCPSAAPSINQIDAVENSPYLLITGSLWYGPNAEGSAWFIKNVWHKLMGENQWISSNLKLIVAGLRPGRVIQALATGQNNIEIIDSPRDMRPYFENAFIYLAPIFSGAGMKVKVAEALSYGLPVIGTSHALTGYKITDRENGYRADCADEFIKSLEHYIGLSFEDKSLLKEKAYQLFLDNHSIVESKISFQEIISDLVQT
jgi:glycosyltransferase involved in cell wall biosynthesis